MKRILSCFKNYKLQTVLAPLFKFAEAALDLLVPLVIASIIDTGIANRDTGFILSSGGILVLFAAVGLTLALIAQYFSAKAAIGVCTELRSRVFDKVQRLSYARLDEVGASTLITRLTSDTATLQTGINLALRLLLRSPFVVFGAMAVAFTIDTGCALIFAAVIAVLLVIVFFILLVSIPRHALVQRELDGVTGAARENLSGVRVIRAFLMEEEEKREFEKRSAALRALSLAVGRISALLNPATLIAVNIAVIALIWSGAVRVNIGTLTQGQVVALYNLLSQILVELVKMANFMITAARAAASAKRIAAVLEMDEGEKGGSLVPDENAPHGEVVFEKVGFEYENAGAPSLFDISFKAEPGQTVGIIGGTGSGKSTLSYLVSGFFFPTEGEIFIDGVNIREMDASALRSRISVVPQKAVLTEGTIRSNLLMGDPDADEARLANALKTAQAYDFVTEREAALDERVLRGGSNFSGGQKQRLSIARALVKKSEILILDDSASALDYATDARLREALKNTDEKRTTFIISQRAASIMHADLIIVLDEGRAVGMGRHEALLRSCPIYREIYEMQTGRGASA
ncbi:MAG: ABC transporter ATP-binding protein [Clostridia bacterium]|nr:ABC transporter ATP-binding protein [Clostridia bacterium]